MVLPATQTPFGRARKSNKGCLARALAKTFGKNIIEIYHMSDKIRKLVNSEKSDRVTKSQSKKPNWNLIIGIYLEQLE